MLTFFAVAQLLNFLAKAIMNALVLYMQCPGRSVCNPLLVFLLNDFSVYSRISPVEWNQECIGVSYSCDIPNNTGHV